MNKSIFILLIFFIISCSESNEITDNSNDLYPLIENYSTDFGYSGDEIIIYGKNSLFFLIRTTHILSLPLQKTKLQQLWQIPNKLKVL